MHAKHARKIVNYAHFYVTMPTFVSFYGNDIYVIIDMVSD